jgi:hypothetical protein
MTCELAYEAQSSRPVRGLGFEWLLRELWSKLVFGVRQGFEGGGALAENVACRE